MDQATTIDFRRFQGVIAIQEAIADARGNLATVMQAIVHEASVMPQANGVVVELRDGDQIFYAAASGTSAAMLGLRLPIGTSLSGRCVLSGQPMYCRDSEVDPRVNREACRRVGLRSMIVIPVPHRGQTVGVLKYHAPDPDAFDEHDMLMAHLLVGPIAVGMSSVGEEDALRAKTELQAIVELKEQLVSTVSHELRTPVTSIAGSLKLLHSGAGGDLSDVASSLIDIASRNAERMKRLVNDLLDVERLDSGLLVMAHAPIDLCEMLRDSIEQTQPFAEQAGVRLVLDVPPEPLIAMTDGDRLQQAITNLVSNGAKFSPAGSAVTVSLRAVGGDAVIRVCDEGPGVPEAFRQRLFDRFTQSDTVRTKENLPGTGLGLAITKAIARGLGGDVRLDETYAAGAAFELTVPIDAGASEGGASA